MILSHNPVSAESIASPYLSVLSYSNYDRALEGHFEAYPGFANARARTKELLQTENDLQEIVQLVGKDSLSEDQKIIMDISRFPMHG